MNSRFTLFAFALLAFGTVSVSAAVPSDAEATAKLIGEWTISGEKAQVVSKGNYTFKGDGTFSSTIDITAPNLSLHVQLEGKWTVKDGILAEEITKSSDTKRVAVGSITRDTLLDVTDKSFQSRTERDHLESYTRH